MDKMFNIENVEQTKQKLLGNYLYNPDSNLGRVQQLALHIGSRVDFLVKINDYLKLISEDEFDRNLAVATLNKIIQNERTKLLQETKSTEA